MIPQVSGIVLCVRRNNVAPEERDKLALWHFGDLTADPSMEIGHTQLHSGHRAVDSVKGGAWYTAVGTRIVLSAPLGHS